MLSRLPSGSPHQLGGVRQHWHTGVQGHDDDDDVDDVDDDDDDDDDVDDDVDVDDVVDDDDDVDDDDFPICHLQFIVAYCVNRYRPVESCFITTS